MSGEFRPATSANSTRQPWGQQEVIQYTEEEIAEWLRILEDRGEQVQVNSGGEDGE